MLCFSAGFPEWSRYYQTAVNELKAKLATRVSGASVMSHLVGRSPIEKFVLRYVKSFHQRIWSIQ